MKDEEWRRMQLLEPRRRELEATLVRRQSNLKDLEDVQMRLENTVTAKRRDVARRVDEAQAKLTVANLTEDRLGALELKIETEAAARAAFDGRLDRERSKRVAQTVDAMQAEEGAAQKSTDYDQLKRDASPDPALSVRLTEESERLAALRAYMRETVERARDRCVAVATPAPRVEVPSLEAVKAKWGSAGLDTSAEAARIGQLRETMDKARTEHEQATRTAAQAQSRAVANFGALHRLEDLQGRCLHLSPDGVQADFRECLTAGAYPVPEQQWHVTAEQRLVSPWSGVGLDATLRAADAAAAPVHKLLQPGRGGVVAGTVVRAQGPLGMRPGSFQPTTAALWLMPSPDQVQGTAVPIEVRGAGMGDVLLLTKTDEGVTLRPGNVGRDVRTVIWRAKADDTPPPGWLRLTLFTGEVLEPQWTPEASLERTPTGWAVKPKQADQQQQTWQTSRSDVRTVEWRSSGQVPLFVEVVALD